MYKYMYRWGSRLTSASIRFKNIDTCRFYLCQLKTRRHIQFRNHAINAHVVPDKIKLQSFSVKYITNMYWLDCAYCTFILFIILQIGYPAFNNGNNLILNSK